MNFSYTYDANGNITQLYDRVFNKTSVYKYDDLNRLSSADVYAGALQFGALFFHLPAKLRV